MSLNDSSEKISEEVSVAKQVVRLSAVQYNSSIPSLELSRNKQSWNSIRLEHSFDQLNMHTASASLHRSSLHRSSLISLFFLAVLSFVLVARSAKAQELDAQVDLNISALSEQDRVQWNSFKGDVQSYLNSYNWTTSFTGDRIRCTFQFNILSANGSTFNAQVFITSSRPLYKNDQLTTMARFFDNNVQFPYIRGEVLQRGGGYRGLESMLDFYVYVILGLDYDSYNRQGGTQYFQQANEIAAVATAASGMGWERSVSATGTYSRVGYIEDILDANQRALRDLMFEYNYHVLDLESTKPEDARTNLAMVVDSLVMLKKQSSLMQRSPFIRAFFEAKYPELSELGRMFPDNLAAYFTKLVYLDPLHETYYDQIREKLGG